MSSFITAVDLSFPPAERVGAEVEYFHYLPHEKQYVVNVYFIGPHPEPETIDRVLRECLALAAAHDGRFNIHASAYLLPQAGADKDGRQEVQPYKMGHFLCFDAALRQIGVRRYGKKHFEQKWVITDVTAAGTGDNETYLDRPVHPLHDSYLPDEGESTDATEDMRVQVLEWVWYGYYTAAAILTVYEVMKPPTRRSSSPWTSTRWPRWYGGCSARTCRRVGGRRARPRACGTPAGHLTRPRATRRSSTASPGVDVRPIVAAALGRDGASRAASNGQEVDNDHRGAAQHRRTSRRRPRRGGRAHRRGPAHGQLLAPAP